MKSTNQTAAAPATTRAGPKAPGNQNSAQQNQQVPPPQGGAGNTNNNTAPPPPPPQQQPIPVTPPLYAHLEQYVRQDSTELLAGSTVAIDVRYWLRRMEPSLPPVFSFQRDVPKINDHMAALCGGVPLTLRTQVVKELVALGALKLRVLLVFDGMSCPHPETPHSCPMSMAEISHAHNIKHDRDVAWARVSNGTLGSANPTQWMPQLFADVRDCRLATDEVFSEVMRIVWELRETTLSHVDFIRAPCTAVGQLAYMLGGSQMVHSVYSSPNLLWWSKHYKVPAVILEICPKDENFLFMTADTMLSDTLPSLSDTSIALTDNDLALCYPIFMTPDAHVEVYNETVTRLDDIVYFHHAHGLLSTALLAAASTATMLEAFPAADSKELRAVLERVIPLRTQLTCKLLPTHHHHQQQLPHQLRWYRWFKAPNSTDVARPPPIELDEWDVSESTTDYATINFNYVLRFNALSNKQRRIYNSYQEVLCAVFLKFLDLLGYFTHSTVETDQQTSERSGKSVFSEALSLCRHEFCESAVLLIELVRTKAIGIDQMTDPVDGSPITAPPFSQGVNQVEFNRKAALLARLYSLAPVEVREDARNWDSHVSKDLVAFWAIVKTFRTTLRHLGEVVCVTTSPSVSPMAAGYPTQIMDLLGRLPFSSSSNFMLGAVIEYCIAMGQNFRDQTITTAEKRVQHLQEVFPCIKDIKKALQTALQWSEDAQQMVKLLSETEEEAQQTREYLKVLYETLEGALHIARQVNSCLFDQPKQPTQTAPPTAAAAVAGKRT